MGFRPQQGLLIMNYIGKKGGVIRNEQESFRPQQGLLIMNWIIE